MARIPDEVVARIKLETSLERLVASSGVQLERRGRDLVGRCCRTRPGSTLDRVEPKSLGGDVTRENITPACTHCNSSKGPRVAPKTPPSEYVGPWPPRRWPKRMQDWWHQTYGGGL